MIGWLARKEVMKRYIVLGLHWDRRSFPLLIYVIDSMHDVIYHMVYPNLEIPEMVEYLQQGMKEVVEPILSEVPELYNQTKVEQAV